MEGFNFLRIHVPISHFADKPQQIWGGGSIWRGNDTCGWFPPKVQCTYPIGEFVYSRKVLFRQARIEIVEGDETLYKAQYTRKKYTQKV